MEKTISTATAWGYSRPALQNYMLNTKCLSSSTKSQLHELGYGVDSDQWIGYLGNGTDAAGNKSMNLDPIIPAHCLYTFDDFTLSSVNTWLNEYFIGKILPIDASSGGFSEADPKDAPLQLLAIDGKLREGSTVRNGPPPLQLINATFQNVADSLTNYIRQNVGRNSSALASTDPAIGDVLIAKTFIHVQWKWLIFPAVIVGTSLLFFIRTLLVAIAMRRDQRGFDWKSSIWPLLFGGVEPAIDGDDEIKDIEKKVDGLKAELRWEGGRSRFLTTPDEMKTKSYSRCRKA